MSALPALPHEPTARAADLAAAELIWPGLRMMPSWALEAQQEFWTREAAEIEARPATWCGGLMAAFVLHCQIERRLEVIAVELDRREAIERHGRARRATARFTAEFLEEVQRRCDLATLVMRDYPEARLKRVHGGYEGHCPFHADDDPSLHLYDGARQSWFCFGACAQGGDVFTWLEVQEASRSFIECVEIAAYWAGIAIPERQRAIGTVVPVV